MIAATLTRNIEIGAKKRIRFSTEIVTTDGGGETRNSRWTYPKHRWTCTVEPQDEGGADFGPTRALFYAAGGSADTFLLNDWTDNELVADPMGVGDGVTTTFQAMRNYTVGGATGLRKITRLVGSPSIYLNGVLQVGGYAIDNNTGVVTFTPAVPNGVVPSISGEFRVLVRFDQDELEITALNDGLYQIEPFAVVEVPE